MLSVLASRRVAGPVARAMVARAMPRAVEGMEGLAGPRAMSSLSMAGVPGREERVLATLVPGDGVGPELVASMEEVFRAISVPVDFEVFFLSEVHGALSSPLDSVVESITRTRLCLKGILTTPSVSATGEADTLNIRLRNQLDLYANVVKVQTIEGVAARHGPAASPPSEAIDLVVVREQTEGEYSCLEHMSVPGVVESYKVVTAAKSLRIAKFAFDYATKEGRSKVTAIHKANIMKLGDGLFLRSCREVAEMYPHIKFEEMIVDNCCMQMVSRPQQFDVMVMPNLYGNILANLAAGLVGGAGLVAGEGHSKNCVVFETGARHSYSEQAGKNVANPAAWLLTSANFLQHAGLTVHSNAVRRAVMRVLREGKVKTKDLGGHASTRQFTEAVVAAMALQVTEVAEGRAVGGI